MEHSEHAIYMGLVMNLRKNGELIGLLPDGDMWLHHDGSPYRSTVLYALHVTFLGDEIRFVDMRAVCR